MPEGKVINSCGKKTLGYNQPSNAEDCTDENGVCCYVTVTIKGVEKKFCATSPSMIKGNNVTEEIRDYIDAEKVTIKCNDGSFIKMVTGYIIFLVIALL